MMDNNINITNIDDSSSGTYSSTGTSSSGSENTNLLSSIFSKIGNTFKASREHDDLAMSTVNACTVFDHPQFNIIMEDILGFNQEVFDKYVEMKDDKFANMYDNYDNLVMRGDSDFYGGGYNRGGYFGNKGLYN